MEAVSNAESASSETFLSSSEHVNYPAHGSLSTSESALHPAASLVGLSTSSLSHGANLAVLERNIGSVDEDSHNEPGEVVGTNTYNNNIEFHGNSSSISFLLLTEKDHRNDSTAAKQFIISSLHNPATDPAEQDCLESFGSPESSYDYFTEAAQQFINGYFDGLHYAQPILNRETFLGQCRALWRNGRHSCSTSFLALYYSVLSLGALTMVWDDDGLIDGKGRLEWSRILLNIARKVASSLCQTTDLEAVQSFFFIAKVCQNELSPHSAYLWTGRAIRVALAIGLNRRPAMIPTSAEGLELYEAQSRTWWLLYCLEVEISFFLGRPDSLGDDCHHNRAFPSAQPKSNVSGPESTLGVSEIDIIPLLARLFQICRSIPTKLYTSSTDCLTKLQNVGNFDRELDLWLESAPRNIRPLKHSASAASLDIGSELPYVRKQRLVLGTSKNIHR